MKLGVTVKKMTALALSAILGVCAAGCGGEKSGIHQTPADRQEYRDHREDEVSDREDWSGTELPGMEEDDRRTVYLLTAITEESPHGQPYLRQEYDYDARGCRIALRCDIGEQQPVWNESAGVYEYVYASNDGRYDYALEYRYDELGNLTAVIPTNLTDHAYQDFVNILAWSYEYRYEIGGLPESVTVVNPAGKRYAEIPIECDDQGNVVGYGENMGEERSNSHVFQYDQQGRLTRETYYAMEGTMHWEYEYEMDRLSRAVNSFRTTVSNDYTFHYNSSGLLESIQDMDGTELLHNSYDGNGHLTEICFRGDTYDVACDENGNVVRTEDQDGIVRRYEYERAELSAAEAQHYAVQRVIDGGGNPLRFSAEYSSGVPYYLVFMIPNPVPALPH